MSRLKLINKNFYSKPSLLIKQIILIFFGISLFFLPSNNWLSQSHALPYQSQSLPPVSGFENFKPADYPEFVGREEEIPDVSAASAILVDRDSGVVLFAKNEKKKLLPASTIKIMTALVAMEYYRLSDVLLVQGSYSNGQDVGFRQGELVLVEDLLSALLISSANDAAMILASHYPGGVRGFVHRMNQKAKELNLAHTYFANPTGLDSDEDENLLADFSYSTAFDLARLARWALLNDFFAAMVSTPHKKVYDLGRNFYHPLYNINELLGTFEGVRGVKTGWTEEAGECFVGYTERNGRGIISVVLKSNDRFGETRKLVDWAFENFNWRSLESASWDQ